MIYEYYNYGALLVLVGLVSALGCADENETASACVWVFDKSECKIEEAGGETGAAGETDGAPPDPCTTEPDTHLRTVFQCEGSVSAKIQFKTIAGDCAKTLGNPALCDEFHDFGPVDDPPEMPAVMACCDPLAEVEGDHYLPYCGADLIEQFCASIPHRLQSYIDKGAFPVGKNQAQKLQNYLADNQQTCYNTFNKPTGVGTFGPVSWLVNDGANGKWPLLSDFTITLESAAVTSASPPEDEADYLDCVDASFNNTEVFEDSVPSSPGINSLAQLSSAGSVSVTGPVVLGGRVTGLAGLSSEAGSCVDPWCSFMEITVDDASGFWTLEELELYADGVVAFTTGSINLDVDRGAIRLYGVALGETRSDRRGTDIHTIDAGGASFAIGGMSAFTSDVRWGKNASPITMHEARSAWIIDSFVVEHIDRAGERWTVLIPRTTWD